MDRYLIALDLDGTTLNQKGALGTKTVATLQAVERAGHAVVLATGRPDAISVPFYDQLALRHPMINFNGALIHQPHQQWAGEWQATIDIATALALRQFREEFGVHLMVAEGKDMLIADHAYTNVPFFPDLPHPDRVLDEAGLTTAPISVTMFIREAMMGPLQQAIHERFPQLTAKTWGAWSGKNAALEVTAPNTSKSLALKRVAADLDIKQTHIMAFGDDMNDADMIQYAGHGVAMRNARPEILALADAVTTQDNDHDGVATYLAEYFGL